MNAVNLLQLALDPGRIMAAQGLAPDGWQQKFLLSQEPQVLLNCCRQAGKSRVVATLALHTALFKPNSLVLLLAPTQRQAHELFRKVLDGYNAIGRPIGTNQAAQTLSKLELCNGSRIVGLPSKEANIRSFSSVNLLLIDEAARVPDDLYRSVRPFLAVSKGRLVALSTPFGQRGWFYKEWHSEEAKWQRICTTWHDVPRITPEFIQNELVSMGQAWVDQEFNCLFTSLEGLVYPDFKMCKSISAAPPRPGQRRVGGIDFGWRNPFAAIWGYLDEQDILWIIGERYARETSLQEHSKALPRGYVWYADPAGRTEIEELRIAGHVVQRGRNDIRLGIAAVTARIRTNRLKIAFTCPNIFQEAELYRYPNESERAVLGENPIDEHNHALAALRYLVSRVDARFIAKLRKVDLEDHGPIDAKEIAVETENEDRLPDRKIAKETPWLRYDNDALWS